MKPLKEMTDVLAGENRVTVYAMKPVVHYITKELFVAKERVLLRTRY